ncbi:MAG: hypothetical protein ACRDL5_07275 [Solirubrobacteraceae bacterium]
MTHTFPLTTDLDAAGAAQCSARMLAMTSISEIAAAGMTADLNRCALALRQAV